MAKRECCELLTLADHETVSSDHEPAYTQPTHRSEHLIKVLHCAGVQDMQCKPKPLGGCFGVF